MLIKPDDTVSKLYRKILQMALLLAVMSSIGCASYIPSLSIQPALSITDRQIGDLIASQSVHYSCNCDDARVQITITDSSMSRSIDSFDIGNSAQYITASLSSHYVVHTFKVDSDASDNGEDLPVVKNQTMRTSSSYSVTSSDPSNESDMDDWYLQNLMQLHLSRIVATEIKFYHKTHKNTVQ